jgi:hypothetical protein
MKHVKSGRAVVAGLVANVLSVLVGVRRVKPDDGRFPTASGRLGVQEQSAILAP